MILHDVRRLDRLISDISDASRLDAETCPRRMPDARRSWRYLLGDLVEVSRQIRQQAAKRWRSSLADRTARPASGRRFVVNGHDLRLGQIITNLIENARSFVPG